MGLLPFRPAGIGWGEALALLPSRLVMDGIPILPLLLALPLGFVWQGAAWPRAASARLAAAFAVFLALGLLAVLLQLGQIHFPSRLAVPGGLFAPLLGFAAGMALWWLLGPSLSRRLPRLLPPLPTRFWPALALSAALSVLLPLDLVAPLSAPALPGSAYVVDIPQRFYLLIKSAILWVPVGFIFTLSGRGAALPRWGVALAVALLLEGVPLLREQPLREVLELLFALPGLWVGAWLGEHSRLQQAPAAMFRATRREVVAAIPEQHPSSEVCEEGVPALPAALEPATSRTRHSRRHKLHSKSEASRHSHPLRWLAGSLLLLAAALGLAVFPMWAWFLGLGMLLYAVALWIWPLAWLAVVPAALPLFDLAPWTGRFFLDEFDLLILVTAGTLFLRGRKWPDGGAAATWPLLALCGASVLISLLLGLGSPPPLDGNAFSSYWSPYNSLRVAKGFVWGGLLYLLLRMARPEPAQLAARLAIGMGVGLLGVGLLGLWERWLFAGFSDGNHTYRIVSTFSSMHTGGGHIEAYLAAALPFLWLGMARWRTLPLAVPVMALTVYVTTFTVARGGVLALGVILLILAVASLRLAWRSSRRVQAALPIGVLALLALGLAVGIGGGYFQKRLAQSGEDWQIRVDHWTQAIAMMDSSPFTQLFGMGLGSFPRVYLERGPVDKQPTTYGFIANKDTTFLRLGSGETLYYSQRVQASAGQTYRLSVDIRSHQNGERLALPLCEKQMLDSRACVWSEFVLPGDGQWHRYTRELAAITVGAGGALRHPPVELSLYHPGRGSTVDVDNLRLLDAGGKELLCNGGFESGGDCWFFKTHSHLPWHIKNLWVHLLFEQGWLGLILFGALTLLALTRLARAAWDGVQLAWAVLASLSGLLTVGMFDSLLDAPRLATLLLFLLLLGSSLPWVERTRSRASRRKKPDR